MQDAAVLNWGMCQEASLDQRPRRGARSKSQAKVQGHPSDPEGSNTKKAAVLLRLCWALEEAAGNVEFPPGSDGGWENEEEQQEFRAMVSDTAGSGSCPHNFVCVSDKNSIAQSLLLKPLEA